jgi:hypothetical protein
VADLKLTPARIALLKDLIDYPERDHMRAVLKLQEIGWELLDGLAERSTRIAELEAECFKLAAHQCEAPNNDEFGHVYCETIKAREAEIARLNEVVTWYREDFEHFMAAVPGSTSACDALEKQMQERDALRARVAAIMTSLQECQVAMEYALRLLNQPAP